MAKRKNPSQPGTRSNALFEEVMRLVAAAKDGKLDERAKVEQFSGQDRAVECGRRVYRPHQQGRHTGEDHR